MTKFSLICLLACCFFSCEWVWHAAMAPHRCVTNLFLANHNLSQRLSNDHPTGDAPLSCFQVPVPDPLPPFPVATCSATPAIASCSCCCCSLGVLGWCCNGRLATLPSFPQDHCEKGVLEWFERASEWVCVFITISSFGVWGLNFISVSNMNVNSHGSWE